MPTWAHNCLPMFESLLLRETFERYSVDLSRKDSSFDTHSLCGAFFLPTAASSSSLIPLILHPFHICLWMALANTATNSACRILSFFPLVCTRSVNRCVCANLTVSLRKQMQCTSATASWLCKLQLPQKVMHQALFIYLAHFILLLCVFLLLFLDAFSLLSPTD